MVGLQRTVSAMRWDGTQGSRSRDGLGDELPANGGTGWPRHGGSGGSDGVVIGLAVGKVARTCAGGVYDNLDPTSGERTVGHGDRRGTLHAQEGS